MPTSTWPMSAVRRSAATPTPAAMSTARRKWRLTSASGRPVVVSAGTDSCTWAGPSVRTPVVSLVMTSLLVEELAHLCPHDGHGKSDADRNSDHRADRKRVEHTVEQ